MSKKSTTWKAAQKARWEQRHQAQIAMTLIAQASVHDYAAKAYDTLDDDTLPRDDDGSVTEPPQEFRELEDRVRALGGLGGLDHLL